MDTAECDTNVLVLNNISHIAFRTYELSRDHQQSYALKAFDVESKLREQGHVVYYDVSRRVVWHFRAVEKDASDEANGRPVEPTLDARQHSLITADEGTIEPSVLQKLRSQLPQARSTPASSASSGPPAPDFSYRQVGPPPSNTAAPATQERETHEMASVSAELNRSSQKRSLDPRIAYENFVIATLSSISTAFSRRSGAIPLDYHTMLLPSDMARHTALGGTSSDTLPIIGTLRAYLTTTGVFVISLGVSICHGLLPFTETINQAITAHGRQVLAAPFGMVNGQLPVSSEGGGTSTAQTPGAHAFSSRGYLDFSDYSWKRTCLRFLHFRGIAQSSLVNCSWASLLVAKSKPHEAKSEAKRSQPQNTTISIPWPSTLCFRRRPVGVPSTNRVGDATLSGREESHDPLGSAQAWFVSTSERDEKIAKRKAERVTDLQEMAFADAHPQRHHEQSPLALRRPSAAAAGSVYPTPPDALQNLNGITPSLDGTLSSPGNALSAAAVPDADQTGHHSAPTTGLFESGRDTADSKGRKSDSNLLGEADHMFGDMGGAVFGDDDITEADFNFFDEEPGDLDLDAMMNDIGMRGDVEAIGVPAECQAPKEEAHEALTSQQTESSKEADDVFTKPELRHAISARNEASGSRGRGAKVASVKRELSPFDPDVVFKRVCASLAVAENANSWTRDKPRTKKIFGKMKFDPTLPMIDRKYEHGGQFDFSKETHRGKSSLEPGALPDKERFRRHGKHIRGQDSHSIRSVAGPDSLDLMSSPVKPEARFSDDFASNVESDRDGSSAYSDDEPISPLRSSVRHAMIDDDAASHITSLRDIDFAEDYDHQLAAELPRLMKPMTSERRSLSVLFSNPEPLALDLSLNDEDLIQVAQVLTEQAASGMLHLYCTTKHAVSSVSDANRPGALLDTRAPVRLLRDVTSTFFKGMDFARLKRFLDVQDVPLQGQPTRLQPRPIPGRDGSVEQMRPSNLYQIPGSHLEVRRSDVKLSVLSSAVTFWESLGLSPSAGGKNISAVCVFPGWKGMADNVKTFLKRVKSVYEVLRLGSVDSMALSPDMEDGILPYEVDLISTSPDATLTGRGSALIGCMGVLRGALNSLNVSGTNVVVYFVYSPSNPATIVEACTAFQRLFDSYQKELAARKESAANELVLQLVSADLLSSPTSVIVTPSAELVRLCMETYDRCTLFGGPMPAPAIRLEQPLPRMIDFKLLSNPSASLMREDSSIHVAYSQTIDDRWITAAWTDDRGNQQTTASYCLRRRNRPASTSVNEVSREIWESTLDLISFCKVHWKVFITKCGPMDQQEVECWVEMARAENKASVTVILLTADTSPFLQLVAPVVKLSPSTVPFYSTPVSTPQASIVSPEQSAATPATPANMAAAATPGADAGPDGEGDTILADVTDQMWGAIVGHRLSSSSNFADYQPALMSGYLIKRTGSRTEDAPVAMEVNLLYADVRAYEPLLREIINHFRGLATLSRAKGVVSTDNDVRPWHIAAAEKASRAIHLLM